MRIKNCSKLIILTIIMSLMPMSVFADWEDPISNPPADNTAKPINASILAQVKNGTLWLGGDGYASNPGDYGFLVEQGNVGIGDTTPSYKLDVNGTGSFRTPTNNGGSTPLAAEEVFRLYRGGVHTQSYSNNVSFLLSRYEDVGIMARTQLNIKMSHGNTSSADANIMTLRSGGNVGIGTTAPGSKLHIVGGSIRHGYGTTAQARFGIYSSQDQVHIAENAYYDGEWKSIEADGVVILQTNGDNDEAFRIRVDNSVSAPNEVLGFSELFAVKTTGYVGIGDINPSTFLDIDGGSGIVVDASSGRISNVANPIIDADAVNKGYADGAYAQIDDALPAGTAEGQTIRYDNSASEWVANTTLYNNGTKIGIGTITPSGKLHVYNGASGVDQYLGVVTVESNSNTAISLLSPNTGSGRIYFGSPSGNTAGSIEYNHNATVGSGYMFFRAGNSEAMRILGNGNVGIGTTAPDTKLHIHGSDPKIKLNNNTSRGQAELIIERGSDDKDRALVRYGGGSTEWNTGLLYHCGGVTSNFYIGQKSFTYDCSTHYTPELTITTAGNVGIGTTAPTGRLSINTGSTISFDSQNQVDGSIDFGNLSSSMKYPVIVGKSTNSVGLSLMAATNNANNYPDMIFYVRETDNTDFTILTSKAFSFQRYTTELMTILRNGDVGIGTDAAGPEKKLHVVGDAKITGELELGGSDVAEEFITDRDYPAGTVLIMGNQGYKSATISNKEYDTSVVGVISDNASLIMGKQDSQYKAVVAMVGVIKVKINRTNGVIHKGDLLTTSNIQGEAMKATNPQIGTIIGKALEDANWKNEVMTLVNLQ